MFALLFFDTLLSRTMKRIERRHLKENPLAVALTSTQEVWREHRGAVVVAGVVLVGCLLVTGVYFGWQQRQLGRASELFAEAMAVVDAAAVPPPTESVLGEDAIEPPPLEEAVPKLLAAADAYPASPQGIAARYQAAGVLVRAGRRAEADEQYQRVIDLAGEQIYGRMARLGLAETYVLAGAYQEAIELFEHASASADSDLPVDGVLMRLGRAYRLAGRLTDALATFTRIVEEFPASFYFQEAEREVEALRINSGNGPSPGL